MLNVVLVELTDGTTHAYAYPDTGSAERSYGENRAEWNDGRGLVFYVRGRHGTASKLHDADDVAHLELTSRDDVQARGVEPAAAVVYG